MNENHFCDERINSICGKIYQRGILYATAVSLIYAVLHYFLLDNIVIDFYAIREFSNFYVFLLPEITVFVCGCMILMVGWLLYGRVKDEREIFEKHNFYLSAGKVFVVVAFIGYAFTIPFATRQWSNDVPLNYLTLLYECLAVVYLYYAFKKNDIFFNYSFIHEARGIYYKRVFLNCAKLAGGLFLGFFGAALLDLGMHQSLLNFDAILTAYGVSVFNISLEYVFISWTEKLSYDEKAHRGLHIGTFVKFIVLLVNALAAFLLMLLLMQITNGSLGEMLIDKGYHLGEIIAEITNMRNHFSHESSVLTAMVLCKFMCQIRNCKSGRRAIGGMVWLICISFLLGYVTTFTAYFIRSAEIDVILRYVSLSGWISIIESLVNAILWTVLIHDLIQTEKLSPYLWFVAGVRWLLTILGALSSLLGNQDFSLFYGIGGGILGLGALVLLLILLHRHQYEHEHEEFV